MANLLEIFRAYDIRGIYPDQLDEDLCDKIGRAFGTLMVKQGMSTVVIGRDDRESSLSLINSLAAGLLSTGVSVINIGVSVQPALHYFTFLDGVDASINVTASHNAGSFNGIKIDLKNAVPFYGSDLKKLYLSIESGDYAIGSGKYFEEDYNTKYIEFISSKFRLSKKLKVVVYCGNGATSEIYPKILEKIGADVVPLRCYYDPVFPAGVPDPETGNFYPELSSQVLESHALLGVGFDSDGDRVGEVDEKGNFYRADEVFLLYVKDILSKRKDLPIIFDVKCSQLVEQYIKSKGGIAKMMPTGRAHFLEAMYSGDAILGCELSGHTYFKDDFLGFDDGIYAACRLLQIMDNSGKKLSQLMKEFPKMVSTPELKYPMDDAKKFEVINKVAKSVKASKKYVGVNELDGVRVKVSETGWFLVRASNTGAYISVRVEDTTKESVSLILDEVSKLLAEASA